MHTTAPQTPILTLKKIRHFREIESAFAPLPLKEWGASFAAFNANLEKWFFRPFGGLKLSKRGLWAKNTRFYYLSSSEKTSFWKSSQMAYVQSSLLWEKMYKTFVLPAIDLNPRFENSNLNLHQNWHRKMLSFGSKSEISRLQQILLETRLFRTQLPKRGFRRQARAVIMLVLLTWFCLRCLNAFFRNLPWKMHKKLMLAANPYFEHFRLNSIKSNTQKCRHFAQNRNLRLQKDLMDFESKALALSL